MPKNYMGKIPKHCTVAELDAIRHKLCVQFWPRLSEYARFVMHNKKLMGGCFVFVWIFPSDLTTELEVAISKPPTLAVLEDLSLSINNKVLYPGSGGFTSHRLTSSLASKLIYVGLMFTVSCYFCLYFVGCGVVPLVSVSRTETGLPI